MIIFKILFSQPNTVHWRCLSNSNLHELDYQFMNFEIFVICHPLPTEHPTNFWWGVLATDQNLQKANCSGMTLISLAWNPLTQPSTHGQYWVGVSLLKKSSNRSQKQSIQVMTRIKFHFLTPPIGKGN